MKVWVVYGVNKTAQIGSIQDLDFLMIYGDKDEAIEAFRKEVLKALELAQDFNDRFKEIDEDEVFFDEMVNHEEDEVYIKYIDSDNYKCWTIACDDDYFFVDAEWCNLPYVKMIEKEVH